MSNTTERPSGSETNLATKEKVHLATMAMLGNLNEAENDRDRSLFGVQEAVCGCRLRPRSMDFTAIQ
jgi:hypothetical protein